MFHSGIDIPTDLCVPPFRKLLLTFSVLVRMDSLPLFLDDAIKNGILPNTPAKIVIDAIVPLDPSTDVAIIGAATAAPINVAPIMALVLAFFLYWRDS